MMEILERRVDSMLSTWNYDEGVAFIPKVEGMVLEAYAEQFFGMKQFPNAEECGVLLKKVWQIKSCETISRGALGMRVVRSWSFGVYSIWIQRSGGRE